MSIEPRLVDQLLRDVRVSEVALGDTGVGGLDKRSPGTQIEAAYLQLVMQRLWTDAEERQKATIDVMAYERLGEAKQIITSHIESGLSGLSTRDLEVVENLVRYLVTPSGGKVAYSSADLAYFAREPDKRVERALGLLAEDRYRILRTAPPERPGAAVRYEIYHDILSGPLLHWRRKRLSQARRWQTKVMGVGLLSIVVAAVVEFILGKHMPALVALIISYVMIVGPAVRAIVRRGTMRLVR